MIPRRPDVPPEDSTELPQTHDRRVSVRYARRLEMLWQLLGLSSRDLTQARVFDVSTSGVGLLLDRPLAVNALLVLRLPTRTAGWGSHLVRVKRCTEQADGTFQVGCGFVKPLTPGQLQGLLG
jgi:hypothetical protein